MTFTEVRTDPLTGVNNRRGLDDALGAQFALMTRYNAIVLAGHVRHRPLQAGERPARAICTAIAFCRSLPGCSTSAIRETDIVARYGGEEFVVVMPHTDLAGACVFAERLRSQVAERLSITVSGGVTAAQEGDTAETLIARADTALYSAKTAGRNRVFCRTADDGPSQPVAVESESSRAERGRCGRCGSRARRPQSGTDPQKRRPPLCDDPRLRQPRTSQHGLDRPGNGRLDRGRALLAEGEYIFGLDSHKPDLAVFGQASRRPGGRTPGRSTDSRRGPRRCVAWGCRRAVSRWIVPGGAPV